MQATSSHTDQVSEEDTSQESSSADQSSSSGSPTSQAPSKEHLITRDIALILFATFLFMTATMLSGPIIAGYAQSLGASGLLMGFVAGALSLASLFCRPIAGNLADRTSKQRLAVVGGLLYCIANLCYVWAPNSAFLLIARMLNGVGFACISVCLSAWLAMLLPISRMGAGMGLYGTMNALSQAVGPDLGIRSSQILGYRPAFAIAVGLSIALIIVVLCIRDGGKPLPKVQTESTSKKQHHLCLRALFEPKVIPIALIFMMFGIPYFANQSFLVDYAEDIHLSFNVSIYFPIYAVALLVMRLLLRNWFDSKSFLFFMILCTISNCGMLLCFSKMNSFWMLIAAALCTAGGYGMMSSVTQARAVLIAGKARSGMANTTYYAGIDLGMFLGPLIGGALYGGLPIAWFYLALLITMPIAWAIFGGMLRTH